VKEEIQHAFLTPGLGQVKVLQLINEQGADKKRAGYLFHLLKRIVDISMPVALVVVLIAECLANRVEELLTKSSQRAISWTIKLEPGDLGVDELLTLITLMSDRLRVQA